MEQNEYAEGWREDEQPDSDEKPLQEAVEAAKKKAQAEADEFRAAFDEEPRESNDESQ